MAASRSKYQRRLQAGLCGLCGTKPYEPGRTRCSACAERKRELDAIRRGQARALGLCDACQRRMAATGRGQRCNVCADKYLVKQRERDRGRYQRRLDAGLCVICGTSAHAPNGTRCASCAEWARAYDVGRYPARKRGLCDACKRRKAAAARELCAACAGKASAHQSSKRPPER